jgi:hypothetical protein
MRNLTITGECDSYDNEDKRQLAIQLFNTRLFDSRGQRVPKGRASEARRRKKETNVIILLVILCSFTFLQGFHRQELVDLTMTATSSSPETGKRVLTPIVPSRQYFDLHNRSNSLTSTISDCLFQKSRVRRLRAHHPTRRQRWVVTFHLRDECLSFILARNARHSQWCGTCPSCLLQ